jgi:hypothetical protein
VPEVPDPRARPVVLSERMARLVSIGQPPPLRAAAATAAR